MGFLQNLLNSNYVESVSRKLALATGLSIRIKKLSSSASEDFRTVTILKTFGFTKVIDVGANTGQFAQSLIDYGYKGAILSLEPATAAYNQLKKRASKHPQWDVAEKCAIGEYDGLAEINISKSSLFNSMKTVTKEYSDYNSDSLIIAKETVPLYKLDTLRSTITNTSDVIFLKIDTQGFEREVLKGATELLKEIKGVKIEIPLKPIYDEVAWGILDIIRFFKDHDFACVSVSEVAVNNQTGVVHEIDAVFIAHTQLEKR